MVDPTELAEYKGKNVIMHLIQPDGSLEEVEAHIEGASPAGVAYKVKGKREVQLAEPDGIEQIEIAPVKEKKASQKKLGIIEAHNVRSHLVDRHGYSLSKANSMDDAACESIHSMIDHTDLGHRHLTAADKVREAEAKEAAKAKAKAERDAKAAAEAEAGASE